MKRKPALYAIVLIFLVVGGAIAWWLHPLPPEVHFVRFAGGGKGVPIFRIMNHSRFSYSYLGTGPSLPYFKCRRPRVPTGVVDEPTMMFGRGDPSLKILTLPPKSSIEVNMGITGEFQEPFQVGFYFLHGTNSEILESWNRQPGPIKQILIKFGLLRSGYGILKPEMIWSDTVTP